MSHDLVKWQFAQNKVSWKNSYLDGFSKDENGDPLPWMSYPAIEYLKENLEKHHEIFEFGCGASTLFFAKKVKKVVGLESNKEWLEIVKNRIIEAKLDNVELVFMKDALLSESYEYYAKNCGQKFDFIIIDSLKRYKSAINSIKALKPGGKIILDDSERDNYAKIFYFFEENGFKKEDFVGIAPAQVRLKRTTVFYK